MSDKILFEKIENLNNELQKDNSTNYKKEVLKEKGNDENIKKLLKLVYDKQIQFNVKSTNLIKQKDFLCYGYNGESIFEILSILSNREKTGHDAIALVNNYIKEHKEYETLIHNIIDKNLKNRLNTSLINKVFPNLIPEFKVALAKKYNDYADKINFKEETWLASIKLDGCRLITIVENGEIKFFSREGKEFFTLDNLKKDIKEAFPGEDNFVLDGEVCIFDENGKEDFNKIMEVIRKKNFTIPNPKYLLFDKLSLEDFKKGKSKEDLLTRYTSIKNINTKNMEVLQQTMVQEYLLNIFSSHVEEMGGEGIIIRKNVGYEGKRTKNLLKVKKFHDAEFEVKEVINGNIRSFDNDLKEVEEEMLSAVVIEYKGNKVKIGSGFSIGERRKFYENPDLIIGKIITVSYFEESKNKSGTVSLKWPTLKYIHGDKREV